jgi:hypothetical protein
LCLIEVCWFAAVPSSFAPSQKILVKIDLLSSRSISASAKKKCGALQIRSWVGFPADSIAASQKKGRRKPRRPRPRQRSPASIAHVWSAGSSPAHRPDRSEASTGYCWVLDRPSPSWAGPSPGIARQPARRASVAQDRPRTSSTRSP